MSEKNKQEKNSNRRTFLKNSGLALGGAGAILSGNSWSLVPNIMVSDKERPQQDFGIQFGDISCDRGIVWGRADRPSRMLVEYSYREDFRHAVKLRGPDALENSDFTARLDLQNLAPDQQVFVRVSFQDLSNQRIVSADVEGHFMTAPNHTHNHASRDIHFVWGGDTAGQGWGINPHIAPVS